MSRNSTSTMGALHPVLFFTLVYIISILMALFVLRSIYISVYGDPDTVQTETKQKKDLNYKATEVNSQTAAVR